jgi:hypothetical protein
MTTETIRPNSNITTSAWGEYNYTAIDEVVTDPTAGDGTILTVGNADESNEQQWGLQTPSGTVGNVTSVVVKILARTNNTSDDFAAEITPKIRSNGVWYSATSGSIATNDTTCSWYTFTITNSMGAISTMSPAVAIFTDFVHKYCDLIIDTVYVNVNYSGAGPSTYALGLLLDL